MLFWALWYSIVFASNFSDALMPVGMLPASWAFSSGNAELVQWQMSSGLAPDASMAFFVGLSFFGTMLLADEIFVIYRVADVAVVHWVLRHPLKP